MLLTVKGLGSLKVADVATVAEVYSPGPHAMMGMKELPARRRTDRVSQKKCVEAYNIRLKSTN